VGLPVEERSNHVMLVGNPGTGKTTVARELGRAYHAVGVVPKDKFHELNRGSFTGQYANNIPLKAHEEFMKAKGGVLFIDEAYELASDEYGRQALTQIMADMENHRGDTVVILAGYPEDMDKLEAANPGWRSRVPQQIDFPDYDEKASRKIMSGFLREGRYVGAPGTSKALDAAVKKLKATGRNGNARDVRNLYEFIARRQERRVAGLGDEELHRITPEDVEGGLQMALASKTAAERSGRRKAKLVAV
jgi:SpoVK/Ycf46/Vps4 family AAA+-type ATPase